MKMSDVSNESSFPPRTRAMNTNNVYILAQAVRNNYTKENLTFRSKSPTQKDPNCQFQNCEAMRTSIVQPVQSLSRSRLPLNMIVSKSAIRKPPTENHSAPLNELDLSIFRNTELLKPSWIDKKLNLKRLQSAHSFNRRKIEEFQAMKSKLKNPQYRSTYSSQLTQQNRKLTSSESKPSQQAEETVMFSQLGNSPPVKPVVMESEDPLLGVFRDDQTTSDLMSNEKENVLFSSPNLHSLSHKFVWNPVIVPDRNSHNNSLELFNSHYSPVINRSNAKARFDSPGNLTTSSSSGLTVAEEEETVLFTYYRERCRVPLRVGDGGFPCDPYENTVEDWQPHCRQFGFYDYLEE